MKKYDTTIEFIGQDDLISEVRKNKLDIEDIDGYHIKDKRFMERSSLVIYTCPYTNRQKILKNRYGAGGVIGDYKTKNVKTITSYLKLSDEINNSCNIIGIKTGNGKRIVLYNERYSECHLLDKNLRIVKMKDDDIYTCPIDLILGYFTDEDSVSIDDIEIFQDKAMALDWLIN
jgi:hypothetical protein